MTEVVLPKSHPLERLIAAAAAGAPDFRTGGGFHTGGVVNLPHHILIHSNPERQRKWDERFLGMADLVASWSKDPSTKVGAVIVRPDRTVASVGFNGFPRGMRDDEELYLDRDVKLSRVVHAELNAILASPEPVKGHTLYLTPFMPCDRCAVHVIQAGIRRVVAQAATLEQNARWGTSLEATRGMFREAGIFFDEIARDRSA